MPQINVVGGYDGVTFPPGTTNQSTSSTLDIGGALESSGGGTLGIASTPAGNGYLGWSIIPEDAYTNTFSPTTTNGYLVRVVASSGGLATHLDFVLHTIGTNTNAVFALYSGASFATGPVAWTTASVHGALTTGLNTVTWNGGTPNVVAGLNYWVYFEITTSAAGTFASAGPTGGSAAVIMNVNLTATASFANNVMTLSAAAPSTITSATTLTPQTSWANLGNKPWFGIRL